MATAFGTPYLARYLDPTTAAATAEWVTRLIVSYGIEPCRDLDDPVLARTWSRPSSFPASPPDPPRRPEPA